MTDYGSGITDVIKAALADALTAFFSDLDSEATLATEFDNLADPMRDMIFSELIQRYPRRDG